MPKGGVRKPALIKRLEGNRGHHPIRDDLPANGVPEPPPGMDKEESALWWKAYRSLPFGVMTSADSGALERYALAWARFRQCQRAIRREGLLISPAPDIVATFRHPMILIQRQAADEMSRAGGELGLSPLARTRLTVEKKEDDDPLNLFLDGRNEGAYLPLQDNK